MDGISSWVGHIISTAAIIGSLAGLVPAIAALAAFFWYVIQVYESKPVQKWIHTRRLRKIAHYREILRRLERSVRLEAAADEATAHEDAHR